MAIDINPSILSSDFSDLRGELAKISTADMAHIDVMDNDFVPNLTFGPPVVERIHATSPIPPDAHLMIADADRNAPVYAEIGCASVTFPAQAHAAHAPHPVRTLRRLHRRIRPDPDHHRRTRVRRPEVPRRMPAEDRSDPSGDLRLRTRDPPAGRRGSLGLDDRTRRRRRRRRPRRR